MPTDTVIRCLNKKSNFPPPPGPNIFPVNINNFGSVLKEHWCS